MRKKRWISMLLTAALLVSMMPLSAFAGEGETGESNNGVAEGTPSVEEFGENTVYYGDEFYPTLVDALKAVYTSGPHDKAEIYCKPGADVGTMTHGHVADDIVIYGNGAKVSGGERDLEVDTFKYSRETGNQSESGAYLDKDISINVYELDGIAAWGQRHTEHAVNLNFYDCQNMQRVYISENKGTNNITLKNCSFDGSDTAEPKSHKDTSIYSNAPGNITVENTTFTNIDVPINLNNKSKGTQNVKVVNSTFNDCGIGTEANKTYAAPVRIVAQIGAETNLTVEGAEFNYTGDNKSRNGDILIGDGRISGLFANGTTTLSMKSTEADVMVQKSGYYSSDGSVKDETKAVTTPVSKDQTLKPNEDGHFEICTHDKTEIRGKVNPKCNAEGYTGDKVCVDCGKIIEYGKPIDKVSHNYVNGECIWCGAKEPVSPPIVITYYDITATQPEHGTITLEHDRIYRYGDVDVTLTAEEGYEVKDLLINGVSVGAVSSYTIKGVTEDIHVTAVFGETEAAKNDRIAKGVQNTTIRMYYKKDEIGKGWIKLRFKKSFGFKVDNYEIFRSAKKKTSFGEKPWFVTKTNKTSGYYKNGKSVKKGTRYYYKMRGVREIAGETYYTQWSNIVMRTGR